MKIVYLHLEATGERVAGAISDENAAEITEWYAGRPDDRDGRDRNNRDEEEEILPALTVLHPLTVSRNAIPVPVKHPLSGEATVAVLEVWTYKAEPTARPRVIPVDLLEGPPVILGPDDADEVAQKVKEAAPDLFAPVPVMAERNQTREAERRQRRMLPDAG